MKRKNIVHFGAGALGRGLVIPVLTDSGCEVTVLDTDLELVDHINANHGYQLYIINEEQGKQFSDIPVKQAYAIGSDAAEIQETLNTAETVTTAVRRGNLDKVARMLAEAWQSEADTDRLVICCENIENVSDFFTDLLLSNAKNDAHRKILEKVIVPDTVVDRGCTPLPNNRMIAATEKYYEIAVDKNVIADTGIALIPASNNIQLDFYRKRFLINTFADVLSFFAIEMGIPNLGEAMRSEKLQTKITPYLDIVKEALILEFGLTRKELDKWVAYYDERFSDRPGEDQRELSSIARSIWDKLDYKERFVYPIILAKKHGHDVTEGVKLIAEMVRIEFRNSDYDADEGLTRLKAMWCIDDIGCDLFNEVKALVKST